MPELRIDPLSGAKVIIATERAQRPGGMAAPAPPSPIDAAQDPFAEGNERLTPPEIWALRPGGGPPDGPGWLVRVIPNLYPALGGDGTARQREAEGELRRRSSGPLGPHNARLELFSSQPARGNHEVIVNCPQPLGSLGELDEEQLRRAVGAWQQRLAAHPDAAYVQLIVNERSEAGASIAHSHAQLYALPFVPAEVARERERYYAYATRTNGENLMAELVSEELRLGERVVEVEGEAVALAPYASRFPFQLMVVPRRPQQSFTEAPPGVATTLARALARLRALFGHTPPLNIYLRTAPAGAEQFCWRIEIVPRLTLIAGLELATGLHLNPVAPERAAAQLREVGL